MPTEGISEIYVDVDVHGKCKTSIHPRYGWALVDHIVDRLANCQPLFCIENLYTVLVGPIEGAIQGRESQGPHYAVSDELHIGPFG